jgi:predicted  nucleic acid-binding Zn-ribbon protein
VKADPAVQRRLLELQAIDTALAQLAHRRATLPQHAEVAALAKEISGLQDEHVTAQVTVGDLDRDIARVDGDVDQVRTRAAKDQTRLDAGTGPARELEALQHELVSLGRRQSDLEDAELELMERRETAAATVAGLADRLADRRRRYDEVDTDRDQQLTEIAQQEQARLSGRAPLVSDLPDDLVGLYEQIRQACAGVGAALLRRGRCEGCRLELSGIQRAAIRAAAPDEVMRCEECRRILVRTDESGL